HQALAPLAQLLDPRQVLALLLGRGILEALLLESGGLVDLLETVTLLVLLPGLEAGPPGAARGLEPGLQHAGLGQDLGVDRVVRAQTGERAEMLPLPRGVLDGARQALARRAFERLEDLKPRRDVLLPARAQELLALAPVLPLRQVAAQPLARFR